MPTTQNKIQRFYTVALVPTNAQIDLDVPMEPRSISLWYTPEQADKLDRIGAAAMDEAARRAERLERREFHTPPEREFEAEVRFIREKFVQVTVGDDGKPVRNR